MEKLRDVALEQFEAVAHELDDAVANKQVRHMLSENARTMAAADVLAAGDLRLMGHLLAESHASMHDDFEITVPAIDTLVTIIKGKIGEAGGVRMTRRRFRLRRGAGARRPHRGRTGGRGKTLSSTNRFGSNVYVCHASAGAGVLKEYESGQSRLGCSPSAMTRGVRSS